MPLTFKMQLVKENEVDNFLTTMRNGQTQNDD